MSEPFALDFSCKSVEETQHAGQDGLLLTGYATRFGEVDQSGEHMTKAALRDLEETWGQQPIVLYEHGLSDLGTRRIGQAIDHHIDDDGLRVRVFVPREPGWKDQRAVRAFKDVYERIKRGVLRGFSVGGTYTRDAAGAIKRWSMLELSVVSKPCLPSATFAVGAKAVREAYGALPAVLDDDDTHRPTTAELAGRDPAFTGELSTEEYIRGIRGEGPAVEVSGMHAWRNVTVSAPVDLAPGSWTLTYSTSALPTSAGTKAVTKAEPDGADHPSSHYLFVGDPAKPTTWKLRYKNAAGDVDPRLLGACHAALTVGYRGNKVDLPPDDKQRCLGKLRALYKQAGLDWPDQGSGSGKKTDLQRSSAEAASVLREFSRQHKAGRMHSAATVAAVRKIADGLQGHVDRLRSHFGVTDQDEEQDQGAPLSG